MGIISIREGEENTARDLATTILAVITIVGVITTWSLAGDSTFNVSPHARWVMSMVGRIWLAGSILIPTVIIPFEVVYSATHEGGTFQKNATLAEILGAWILVALGWHALLIVDIICRIFGSHPVAAIGEFVERKRNGGNEISPS